MAFTSASKDAAVNALTQLGSWVALCNQDPGTVGTGEVTAAGRVQTQWGTSSSGTATGTQLTFSSVPAGSYSFYAVFSAQTGGTYRWGFQLSPGITRRDVGSVLLTPRVTFP